MILTAHDGDVLADLLAQLVQSISIAYMARLVCYGAIISCIN
jgi:hypothetical protein